MSKQYIVIFTDHNAIVKKIADGQEHDLPANSLLNPDLKAVHKIAPHHWKREGDKIVPMTLYEKNRRNKEIAKLFILDNRTLLKQKKKSVNIIPLLLFLLGFLLGWVWGM